MLVFEESVANIDQRDLKVVTYIKILFVTILHRDCASKSLSVNGRRFGDEIFWCVFATASSTFCVNMFI